MPPKKQVKTSATSDASESTTGAALPKAPFGGNLNSGICAFCIIRDAYEPVKPSEYTSATFPSGQILHTNGARKAYLILRTPHVMAFLDINPLVRGHLLVCPVKHTRQGYGALERTTGLDSRSAAEVGRVLPVIARAAMRACFGPDTDVDDSHYNIVQNNGETACQEIPHVHFHIVPRREIINDGIYYSPHVPPLPHPDKKPNKRIALIYATQNPVPPGEYRAARANIDVHDAEGLAADMRKKIAEEFSRAKAVEGVDLEKEVVRCTSPVSNRGAMMMFGRGMRDGSWNSEVGEQLAGKMRKAVQEEFARNKEREDEDEDLEATCWED